MKARELSIFMVLILTAVMALPYRNSYGIPAEGVIPLSSQGRGEAHQTMLVSEDEAGNWTCPMHTDVMMSGPGKCPVCGMNLTPVKNGADSENGTMPEGGADESGEPPSANGPHDHGAHSDESPDQRSE